MSDERPQLPFKNLGERLKTIREKLHESVAEVSGAVEIDETDLYKIEQGKERPSEDILMLLISHFGMQDDDEATNLWKLAGYEQPRNDASLAPGRSEHSDEAGSRAAVLIMAVDPRVIYSDHVQVTANPGGIVINFSQGAGTPQAITTARVGMSRDTARNVIYTLQSALAQSEPRQLPAAGASINDDKPEPKLHK